MSQRGERSTPCRTGTPTGRGRDAGRGIRLAAELLAPFLDRFDTSGTSGDDEHDRHQALWSEIPVGEVTEMLACT